MISLTFYCWGSSGQHDVRRNRLGIKIEGTKKKKKLRRGINDALSRFGQFHEKKGTIYEDGKRRNEKFNLSTLFLNILLGLAP